MYQLKKLDCMLSSELICFFPYYCRPIDYNLFKNLNIIYKMINLFVPKIIKYQSNYMIWFSKNLKYLIFKKKYIWVMVW